MPAATMSTSFGLRFGPLPLALRDLATRGCEQIAFADDRPLPEEIYFRASVDSTVRNFAVCAATVARLPTSFQ